MKLRIAFLILLSTTLLFGQGRNRGRMATWDENLNLTTEQMQQITQMRETMQPAMQELRQNIRELERELRQENRMDNPDAERITELQTMIDDYKSAVQNMMTGHRESIRALLTPEQQAIFDERQFGPPEDRGNKRNPRGGGKSGSDRPRNGGGRW